MLNQIALWCSFIIYIKNAVLHVRAVPHTATSRHVISFLMKNIGLTYFIYDLFLIPLSRTDASDNDGVRDTLCVSRAHSDP